MMIPKYQIRRCQLKDAAARLEAIVESQDHLLPWLPWVENYTLAKSKTWLKDANKAWRKKKDYCFAIIDGNDQYVGEVKILNVNKEYFESSCALAYWVRKSCVKQGASIAACKLAAQFAFQELGLHRVEIMIMPDNVRSLGVAKKLLATQEGYLRNKWIFDGKPQDVILFSLVPGDVT